MHFWLFLLGLQIQCNDCNRVCYSYSYRYQYISYQSVTETILVTFLIHLYVVDEPDYQMCLHLQRSGRNWLPVTITVLQNVFNNLNAAIKPDLQVPIFVRM